MYLVDTNIWLERLLNQEKATDVTRFLNKISTKYLMITDFSFHSIGVILSRCNQVETLQRFTQDLFIDHTVMQVALEPNDIPRLIEVMAQFQLDFDDAYQYVAAEKHDAQIISFDSDFDKTERGRKMPLEVLNDNQ